MSRHLLYVALLALCALSAVSFSTASTSGVDVMSDDFVDATLVELLHTATNTNAEGDASDAGVDEASTEESAPVIVGDGPNRYEVPQLPPLKVGLTEETQPAIHPASGVAPGGVGPTAAELEAIGGPVQPPEGCAHLITAWKNYIWHHRTLPDSGVGGKDKYPQHIIEERFGFFCNNLKHHQIQSANRERVTVKQPDLSYKPINEEHLTWNKYYDLENLKHLRGFRYSTPFRHLTSHSDYLEREFIRTHGTKPAPEDRAAALARKLDALPTSVMDPPSQDHTAPDYPPQSSSRRLLSESEVEAESEFELDPPVISTPAQSLKQVARDPLIPDFDFSLNHNIVGAPYDQNNCGGDWAVHSAAVIEYTFAIQCQDAPYAKTLAELNFGEISSQHLLACSSGNGCKNGDITDALSFALRWPLRNRESYPLAPETFLSEKHIVSVPKCDLSQNEAIEKSAARPLISSFGFAIHTCKQRSDDPFNLCLDQDEEELARFVAKQPVTAVIDANDAVFSALYSGYIITAKDCSSAAGAGDHVVTIVGLLTDAKTGKKVWKIQNSYGQDWGHDGFAYLEYGYNTCGIANYNAFVQTTCQRSVGLNPPPRPATPKQAPEPVTAKSIDVPPPKPAIVPTVPVTPVLGGAPAVDPKQVLAASANSIPWWQVADAKTTVNTMQAATQVVAPAAAAAPTAPAIVSALKAVVQTAALPTASAPAAAPVTAPVPSAK